MSDPTEDGAGDVDNVKTGISAGKGAEDASAGKGAENASTGKGAENASTGKRAGVASSEMRVDEELRPGRRISRRDLLRVAGTAGAAALLPGSLAAEDRKDRGGGDGVPGSAEEEGGGDRATAGGAAPQAGPGRMVNLTVPEAAMLTAMVDRLIPSDEHGPGAVECGALRYIDRELSGERSEVREAYHTGLAGLDRYSRYARGAAFTELAPAVQDSVLLDLQTGGATGAGAGFGGSSGSFFNMVKGHVWQSMFGDPHYGGNDGFAGWDLLRYPGVRMGVSAEDQKRLESGDLTPTRRSAYESYE